MCNPAGTRECMQLCGGVGMSGESLSDERNGMNKRPGGGQVGQCLENRDTFVYTWLYPLEFGVTDPASPACHVCNISSNEGMDCICWNGKFLSECL